MTAILWLLYAIAFVWLLEIVALLVILSALILRYVTRIRARTHDNESDLRDLHPLLQALASARAAQARERALYTSATR
jgi:predicted ferric reductase